MRNLIVLMLVLAGCEFSAEFRTKPSSAKPAILAPPAETGTSSLQVSGGVPLTCYPRNVLRQLGNRIKYVDDPTAKYLCGPLLCRGRVCRLLPIGITEYITTYLDEGDVPPPNVVPEPRRKR